jgi:hypothetical protein
MTGFSTMAAGPLSNGAVQFFAIDTSGNLWTTWQLQPGPSSPWNSPLESVALPSGVSGVSAVQAAALQGGTLQIWVIDNNGNMWSMWSKAFGSGWSAWASGFTLPNS